MQIRKVLNMDMDWRFHRGDIPIKDHPNTNHAAIYHGTKTGMLLGPATKRAYDDSNWEQVNLPHDYMREAGFCEEAVWLKGYRELENGWYRKTFIIEKELQGSHALLVFDGIAVSSVIYLNGSVVERSYSAYSEIVIDVTDRLYYDRINTLAVYVKADETEGWWYEGAGIYRHVNLYLKTPVHIAHNGIWAKPVLCDKEKNKWQTQVEVTLENSFYEEETFDVRIGLYDESILLAEKVISECVCEENGSAVVQTELSVENPTRWDVDLPKLYSVKAEVIKGGKAIDEDVVRIGFRTFFMDPEKGFFFNDRPFKIKGTCNHQDHAGVGIAVADSVQRYRIRLLKEMGTNAYRSAHNFASKEILEACDEIGMLVMDENRKFETEPQNVKCWKETIKRDRNHPSVVFYSLFNEEHLQSSQEGKRIYKRLKSITKKLDDTRIVIGAMNDIVHPDGAGPEMDILGINYNLNHMEEIREQYPDKAVLGTENSSGYSTRGCYRSDWEEGHVLSSYDDEYGFWGTSMRGGWDFVRSHDYFAGYFIWTGFDYRGEPSPFQWPSCSSQFGIMDTCGFPKDSYYFHKAAFTEEPMIHILPHWNWQQEDIVKVMTVSNCEEAELFLNGKSLGRKVSEVCTQCEWMVPFEKGVLAAVGYRQGQAVVSAEIRTAGEPKRVVLQADRIQLHNAGQDTVPVRVSVVDAAGTEVPTASNLIRFSVEGQGSIAGVGNGDPNSHEADHLPERTLYCGLCQVLVAADVEAEKIKLIAESEGLEKAELSFEIREKNRPEYVPFIENRSITGVRVSPADAVEKPDPKKVYAAGDMNSFAPLIIGHQYQGNHTAGFMSGWREYLIPVTLPERMEKDKKPAIQIESVICDWAEFYQNGKLIWEGAPEYKSSLLIPFAGKEGEEVEIRALLKAGSNAVCTSGFGIGMTLTFVEKLPAGTVCTD